MTHSQLTQCPHCKASFKVSEEQINAANGKVRCGACLNIFDAIAYQISSQENAKLDGRNTKENIDTSILDDDLSFDFDDTDLESELLETSQPEDDNDFSVFADDPEEDEQEKGYKGSSKFDDELSASFLELEKPGNDKFKTQFLKDETLEDSDKDSVDESWTSSILDDLEEPKNNRVEPSLSTIDEAETPEIEESYNETTPISQLNPDQFSQKDLNSLNFEYEQDPNPKNNWLIGSILFALNFSLLILLIIQASWFHYEKLVKYPKLAELYAFACQELGCELPKLIDISKIENRSLVVRSHPTTFNALIIETIITNHATFEQAFPNISLSFSNINNQVIAQRLFQPSEYLNEETLRWPGMPTAQPIQITLEIIDPGPDAVNYKVSFHYSHQSSTDQQADQMSTNKSEI
tara:strand:- start:731 stop:1954 length:1224 start_codon:yes stop_codon:yes gene_type:complete